MDSTQTLAAYRRCRTFKAARMSGCWFRGRLVWGTRGPVLPWAMRLGR
ncbi:hypothetical protein LzC2_13180 [Planctomycetes bacterium LzC2]|uniref:Uncharacterized protein n=1 Tax=Alienimonas chondri TaxID=2681879 RepID=A0ABX1VCL3_9PLAN|nr:hypothetical protein [Alienimonas chondri]